MNNGRPTAFAFERKDDLSRPRVAVTITETGSIPPGDGDHRTALPSGTPLMVRERASAAAETILAFVPELRVEALIADLDAVGAKPVAIALRQARGRMR